MKYLFITFIMITFSEISHAQTSSISKVYRIDELGVINSIIRTDDTYCIAGSGWYDHGFGTQDLVLGKINERGDTLKIHVNGSPHLGDKGHKVLQMRNKDLVLIGQMGQPDTMRELYSNAYVLRADSTGRVIWEHEIDSGGGDIAYTGGETPDGGVFIAGVLKQTVNWAKPTAFWAKFSAEGEREYFRTYSHPAAFYAGVALPDGNFVVGGRSANPQDTGYYLLKLDSTGNIIKRFSSKPWASGRIYDMELLNDGSIVVTGLWGGDMLIAKFNKSGQMLWHKRYGGSEAEYGYGMAICRDGGFIITGSTASNSIASDQSDVWLVRADSTGDTLWSQAYWINGDQQGNDVVQTDSGFIVVGSSGNVQGVFIKTDSIGQAPHLKSVDVKFPHHLKEQELYLSPNPAKELLSIQLSGIRRQDDPLDLQIFNVNGEMVLAKRATSHQVSLDISQLPSGFYTLLVQRNNRIYHEKFIIE